MEHLKDFWQINFGQVVSVIVFTFGAVMVWQKMRDKLDSLEKETDRNTSDIESMTKIGLLTTINQHERRITELEELSRDYREMRTDIRWIKEKLNCRPDNQ